MHVSQQSYIKVFVPILTNLRNTIGNYVSGAAGALFDATGGRGLVHAHVFSASSGRGRFGQHRHASASGALQGVSGKTQGVVMRAMRLVGVTDSVEAYGGSRAVRLAN